MRVEGQIGCFAAADGVREGQLGSTAVQTMKREDDCILGIDFGTTAMGVVAVSASGALRASAYHQHQGQLADILESALAAFDLPAMGPVAAVASSPRALRADGRIDPQVALITAVRQRHPDARAILSVGGQNFCLIRLDANGGYLGSRSATSCAAGTGAFLDQQARRLELSSAAELSRVALSNRSDRPRIASRCAVFAKTDLIHAQQQGHDLAAICDGLCHGLARKIVDTLFADDLPEGDIVFCGGVARNTAVRRHIEALLGRRLIVSPESHLYGALGAALALKSAGLKAHATSRPRRPGDLLEPTPQGRGFTYPPLALQLSPYPTFDSLERYLDPGENGADIEVDHYAALAPHQPAYLGLDIGSTSTKAALVAPDGTVLAGFYTRTAGHPLAAVQRLFRSVRRFAERHDAQLQFLGAVTTGSGRQFIGAIVGADLVLDEITAHARAACQLDPEVDTIIEIGGQDAKFTRLQNGRVVSAVMNTVCAAGTGSFIEEQAAKLGCPLDEVAQRALGRRAPLVSDRCTVFMERDLNHYLAEGWPVDEILAAVLHAVRENYLLKVGAENRIGRRICFQGATAKNRALVAAFEQRLRKPIAVSPFCHLTGAIGGALTLMDARRETNAEPATRFRGLSLWRHFIPVRTEVCDLCANHCKLSVAEVDGETVACGFLCGRDYDTRRRVHVAPHTFDPLAVRRRVMSRRPPAAPARRRPIIGLPAAGHLVEDLGLWQVFFQQLGFETVSSENCPAPLATGKRIAGAEFCAPITALHGHAAWLAERCDHIFLPVYLEERTGRRTLRRHYCYYTQFAPVLVGNALPDLAKRICAPLVRYLYSDFHTQREIYRALKTFGGPAPGFIEVAGALEKAQQWQRERRRELVSRWQHRQRPGDTLQVLLLGRPYTLLSPSLNRGIPERLRRLGIDCCLPEMLEPTPAQRAVVAPLLETLHWRHAAEIMTAAAVAAVRPGLYPVLVTSFKCSPDSFTAEYFRRLMHDYDKPYLILELDEHDSPVGYETRIEAAVRAFRNHWQADSPPAPVTPRRVNPAPGARRRGKTIVLPNWDRLSGRLLTGVLQHEGQPAVLIEETATTIAKSLRSNTGQCIPINAIVEGFAECLQQHRIDPRNAVLWVGRANIACNVALYPHHMRWLLAERGGGLERAGVYTGDVFFTDISTRAAINAVLAYMFGGLLRRVACRLRPYERIPGETDQVLDWAVARLHAAFATGESKDAALDEVIRRFEKIRIRPEQRPKVAIFGDLYSRDNRAMNQDLVRFIEAHGGEVVSTPYNEYARMIAFPYLRKWFTEGRYLTALTNRTLMAVVGLLERHYYRYFQRILGEPMAVFDDDLNAILAPYGVRQEHAGESLDNLIKVHYLKKHHPDLSLFVQASPALCCPSLVTEAMARRIEAVTGVPVVSIVYDGTGDAKNAPIIAHLQYPRRAPAPTEAGLRGRSA